MSLVITTIPFARLIGFIGAWLVGEGTRAIATRRVLAPYLRSAAMATARSR